jgi:hypothetical protein
MKVMKLCVHRLMSACNQRGGCASIIITLKTFVTCTVTIMTTAVANCVTCNQLVWADCKTHCRLLMQYDRNFTDIILL